MSSSLTEKQVQHIAVLARLELTSEEMQEARGQLGAVLGYFDGLSAVDTSNVAATLGVQPHTNAFRKDEVRPSLPVEQALANAPRRGRPSADTSLGSELDGFQIPRILEEE